MPRWPLVLFAFLTVAPTANATPRAKTAARKPRHESVHGDVLPLSAPEQRLAQALGLPKPRAEIHPHAVILSRPGFISLYDPDRKIPIVVSWATSRKTLADEHRAEPSLPPDLALPAAGDYLASGYTRGFLAPSPSAAVAIPQAKSSRTGPWGQFEDFYRAQVQDSSKVAYVQSGPILEGEPKTIGNGIAVPSHAYAIVVLADEGVDLKTVRPEDVGASVKVLAVVVPNNDSDVKADDAWTQYLVPVSQVASRSHHPGFLSGLSDETRRAAWNHRPEKRGGGGEVVVDGIAVPKKRPRGTS